MASRAFSTGRVATGTQSPGGAPHFISRLKHESSNPQTGKWSSAALRSDDAGASPSLDPASSPQGVRDALVASWALSW